MEQILRDKGVPCGMLVDIATRYLTEYASQWWSRQRYHSQSYHWRSFVFIIQRFFKTSRGIIDDDVGIPVINLELVEHMDSSEGEN